LRVEPLEDRVVLSGFNPTGIVTTDLGRSEQAEALAVQPDGKIVAVANTRAVLRYLPDGTLDPTFSGDGVANAFNKSAGSAGGLVRAAA
jgi:hypothetical protein